MLTQAFIRFAIEIPNIVGRTGPEYTEELCRALELLLPDTTPERGLFFRVSHAVGAEASEAFEPAFAYLEPLQTWCILVQVDAPLTDEQLIPVLENLQTEWKLASWCAINNHIPLGFYNRLKACHTMNLFNQENLPFARQTRSAVRGPFRKRKKSHAKRGDKRRAG
jgi:hypothetical protein